MADLNGRENDYVKYNTHDMSFCSENKYIHTGSTRKKLGLWNKKMKTKPGFSIVKKP